MLIGSDLFLHEARFALPRSPLEAPLAFAVPAGLPAYGMKHALLPLESVETSCGLCVMQE